MLLKGDCLVGMKELGDSTIDSVVSDPPYGLEFMGNDWDAPWKASGAVIKDPAALGGFQQAGGGNPYTNSRIRYGTGGDASTGFQQWFTPIARECFRVLKPGGFMLAFGGSRTYHRLACAVEDAGFEIVGEYHWLYGCLSEDTEVLTPDGWMLGVEAKVGDIVAQWDQATGQISLAPVQETYRAPWDGDLVVLRNSDTDQLLTPNHRVYWERNAHRMADGQEFREWVPEVSEASELPRKQQFRLPLAGIQSGPGIGGTDYAALLGWVWTEGGFDRAGTGVRIYQSSVNQNHCDEIAALMDRAGTHERYDRDRIYINRKYTESTWFFSGDLAKRVRRDLPGKHPTYDLLWRMTSREKEAFLEAALNGDGSQSAGGSWSFEQKDASDREWLVTLLAMMNRRGNDYARKARDGGSVSISQSHMTNMTPTTLATDREHYQGDVWCVRVPSSAFVARRNGKVFITGNSGFPKSMDVAKAIDKDAGHWRGKAGEVVSTNDAMSAPNYERTAKGEPVTEDAQKWSGWGTALKPSHEPVVIARKPDGKKFAPSLFTERFFYCPKPSTSERDAGLEKLALNESPGVLQMRQDGGLDGIKTEPRKNFHPTVKPLDLMRHLISLVTPEEGTVLDPFLGSGTTAAAAILDGFHWYGCELTEDYWPLIEARVAWAEEERKWALIQGTQLNLFDGL